MRVAILLEQCLAPVPGGTGRYAKEIARALATQDGRVDGWIAWHRDVSAAQVDGVDGPHRLPLPRRPLTLAWERRVGPAPRHSDIIHAPTPLFPPKRKAPIVVTVHDAVPWTHPETLTPRGVGWHRRMIAHAAREADRIVVPTQSVADELTEQFTLTDRLVVIGHGVSDATQLPPDADARAARLRLPTDGYWLSLATLEPRKGLDILIDALADPAAPDLPLLVVGQPGWGGVDPATRAASVGVPAERLRVLGKLNDADLAVVLSNATALVAPSRAEGFGLPVVEAMAAGTPVISSDAPALVEVGGDATLHVPREDAGALAAAMRELAEDGRRRDELARAGRERSRRYRWSTAATELWKVYRELV